MISSLRLLVVLCSVTSLAVGDQWQDAGAGYPSASGSGWQNYPSQQPSYPPVTYNSGPTNCAPSVLPELPDFGSYKSSLLQTGLSAAIAALLAKLPALIFLKVIIFKLIVVPMLFMMVAMPVLMPLLMMLMPMMMNMMNMMNGGDMSTTTAAPTTPAMGRSVQGQERVSELDEVLRALLGSHKCLERVACQLGARDKQSTYRKPITWMLKQLQTMVPGQFRDRVKSYRQAYMTGAAKETCDQEVYPCDTPRLVVEQEGRTFRIL